MTSKANVPFETGTTPVHYLVRPALSWKYVCNGQALPAGPRVWRRWKEKGFIEYLNHTEDANQVTCPECISTMARDVGRTLTSGVKCVNCAGVGMNTKAALSKGEPYVRCATCNGTGVCEVYQP